MTGLNDVFSPCKKIRIEPPSKKRKWCGDGDDELRKKPRMLVTKENISKRDLLMYL